MCGLPSGTETKPLRLSGSGLTPTRLLHNEFPGIHIPDRVLTWMANSEAHGEHAARAEGVSVTLEGFEAARNSIAGVHIHVADGNLGARWNYCLKYVTQSRGRTASTAF